MNSAWHLLCAQSGPFHTSCVLYALIGVKRSEWYHSKTAHKQFSGVTRLLKQNKLNIKHDCKIQFPCIKLFRITLGIQYEYVFMYYIGNENHRRWVIELFSDQKHVQSLDVTLACDEENIQKTISLETYEMSDSIVLRPETCAIPWCNSRLWWRKYSENHQPRNVWDEW